MPNAATNPERQRERARQRAEMILKVRGGQLSASEAAQALGIGSVLSLQQKGRSW